MEQITIRQISAAMGYSAATVSLALRGHPRISKATRDAIQAKADEMGYRPNPVMAAHWTAVRMRQPSKFQSVIALLNDWDNPQKWRTSLYLKPFTEAFERRAESLGYLVEEFALVDNKPLSRRALSARLESISKVFRARGIGAFAVFSSSHPELIWQAAPHFSSQTCVFIGNEYIHCDLSIPGLRHIPYHRVSSAGYSNMILLLDELRALGYKRPGYWPNRWSELGAGGEPAAAFNFYLQSLPEKDRLLVQWPDWNVAAELSELKFRFLEWLEQARPDVVICGNLEVHAWIESTARKIPRDIGLAHIDLSAYEQAWSGIYQRHDRLAAAAVDLLTSQLNRNERGVPEFTKEIRIEGEWVAGGTTRLQQQ
ncbi:MAG: LacI family DNA-binding transcriptional regulator [Luteolibacter sp.]